MSTETKVENCQGQCENATAARYARPRVNITETKTGYTLEAEMPGVNKSGLEVQLNNNELTIVGRRNEEQFAGETIYRESTPYAFRRVFTLSPEIDAARIEAKIEQGVLRVQLPKAEKAGPRKIEVV